MLDKHSTIEMGPGFHCARQFHQLSYIPYSPSFNFLIARHSNRFWPNEEVKFLRKWPENSQNQREDKQAQNTRSQGDLVTEPQLGCSAESQLAVLHG